MPSSLASGETWKGDLSLQITVRELHLPEIVAQLLIPSSLKLENSAAMAAYPGEKDIKLCIFPPYVSLINL